MVKRKIYVASSWRNAYQPTTVKTLRAAGHEVYDFREPTPGGKGFGWSQIDPNWLKWTPREFTKALSHPIANGGYKHDKDALDWCDTGVLVLPSGMSAHLEAGYIRGQGKPVFLFMPELKEPELMYKLFEGDGSTIGDIIAHGYEELIHLLKGPLDGEEGT